MTRLWIVESELPADLAPNFAIVSGANPTRAVSGRPYIDESTKVPLASSKWTSSFVAISSGVIGMGYAHGPVTSNAYAPEPLVTVMNRLPG